MKKILKWAGIIILVLVAFAGMAAFYFSSSFESRTARAYEVNPQGISIPTDSASIAEGHRLVSIHCMACHGKDLGGDKFFDDPNLGSIPASNLTSGKGGVGVVYQDIDFVRAIRHGVKKDGKPAFVMPAKEFQHMSDEDLGCIIAYLKTAPPVDRQWNGPQLTFLARSLAGAGVFGDIINAENIDHVSLTRVTAPTPGATTEYGEYLVRISGCQSCHGEKLEGRQPDEPGAPFAPNLTPGGNLGHWSQDQFISTLRTGTTPEKRQLNPQFMPYKGFGLMNEEELSAIYKFLSSQPKLAVAN